MNEKVNTNQFPILGIQICMRASGASEKFGIYPNNLKRHFFLNISRVHEVFCRYSIKVLSGHVSQQ